MKHALYSVLAILSSGLICLATASAQTSGVGDSYDANSVLNKINVLRAKSSQAVGPLELESLCRQAILHQDVNALVALESFGNGNVKGQVIRGVFDLSASVQKPIIIAILRDDELWNYDRARKFTRGGFKEGQFERQLYARDLVSKFIGRDLRRSSKHYNSDARKQDSAESADEEAAVIDVATREQIANEILSK